MRISGENNIIQASGQIAAPNCLSGRCLVYSASRFVIVLNKIDQMDSKICFEMSVFVVEAMRTLCASFMIVTATV